MSDEADTLLDAGPAIESEQEAPEASDKADTEPEAAPEDSGEEEANDNEDEAEAETEDDEEGDGESDGEDDASETVTVEYEGKEYDLPPELKDALLRQSDYTRKTQEVAETRKELEARQASIEQQEQLRSEHAEHFAELAAVDRDLQRFANLDWQRWIDEDPQGAQKAQAQYQALKDQRQQAETRLMQSQDEALKVQREEHAKALEEGQKVLARDIPGWGPDKAREVAQYAVSHGIPAEQVSAISNPTHVKLLHKAMAFDRLQEQRQKPAPKKAEPAKRVKGKKSSATVDPDKLTPEQWVKWRESQLKKKENL